MTSMRAWRVVAPGPDVSMAMKQSFMSVPQPGPGEVLASEAFRSGQYDTSSIPGWPLASNKDSNKGSAKAGDKTSDRASAKA